MRINSDGNVVIAGNIGLGGTTPTTGFISPQTGYAIRLPLNGTQTFNNNSSPVIFSGSGASGDYRAGTLNFQSRGDGNGRDINFINGATPTLRMRIDSSGNLLFNSGYGSVATAFGCRAWVNFKGTGTVAIRESGNVSSITDNGTADYTVNFTTAMPDVNYATTSAGNQNEVNADAAGKVVSHLNQTTSSVRVRTGWFESDRDFVLVAVAIFR
jgi:hypothetical protein